MPVTLTGNASGFDSNGQVVSSVSVEDDGTSNNTIFSENLLNMIVEFESAERKRRFVLYNEATFPVSINCKFGFADCKSS